MRGLPFLLASWMACTAWAAPGYSVWGTFKYAPGFDHFDYVNPNAPKGGELRMVSGLRVSTFDKYNPFTLKGRLLLDLWNRRLRVVAKAVYAQMPPGLRQTVMRLLRGKAHAAQNDAA